MKLLSAITEFNAIYLMLNSNRSVSGKMVTILSDDHFYLDATKETFRRIKRNAQTEGSMPDWVSMLNDPSLGQTIREELQTYKKYQPIDKMNPDKLSDLLEKYRRIRSLFGTAELILKELDSEAVEIDRLLDIASEKLFTARNGENVGKLTNFGHNNNSKSLVYKILSNEKPDLIPTGFKAFDDENGGLPTGLIVIGATTSGGKSVMAAQLLKNMAEAGYSSALVPLEMDTEECTERFIANIAKINITKLVRRQTTPNEKKKAIAAYNKWVKARKDAGVKFTIYDPEADVTIQQILFTLSPYDFDTIIIDYVSLLKGVDSADSWRLLSNVARFAKVYGKTHKKRIILIVQVNEEGLVRYSKGVIEHANNAWVWVATDETEEMGVIEVRQLKARKQKRFPFTLKINPEFMEITDISDEELHAAHTPDGDKKRSDLDNMEAGYLKDIGSFEEENM